MEIKPGPVPPWQQVKAIIVDRIEASTYPPGGRLPSISDLAVEFGVARTTIQKATESLRDEGVIQTSPMGMFVSG
jgi:DNA-binding GntR family transcriptional regulator